MRSDLDVLPPQQIDAWGRWGAGRAPFLPPDGRGPQGALYRYGQALLLEYLRALADLEEERQNGAITEAEYDARQQEIMAGELEPPATH